MDRLGFLVERDLLGPSHTADAESAVFLSSLCGGSSFVLLSPRNFQLTGKKRSEEQTDQDRCRALAVPSIPCNY